MIWLEKQTSKGVLKYRMPNISEGYHFLSMSEDIGTARGILALTGKIIETMGNLVNTSSVGYDSYTEMLNDKENMWKPLTEISNEIINDINGVLIKKD